MKCEFEEKTYEQYHNIELLGKSKIFFPPGQIRENILGFDSALFSKNRKFWKLWGVLKWWFWPPVPRGVYLDIFWDDLKEIIDKEIRLEFKFNICVQYKRSEYMKSNRAKEFTYWRCPYYRYDIDVHQQQILSQIERRVNDQAIVVYAAPAFHTNKELFDYFGAGKLVENSNYVKPSILDNHQRWTYVNSGTVGWAFSEPEGKESIKLMNYINIVKENTRKSEIESNSQFISKTSSILVGSIRDTEYLSKVFDRLMEQIILPEHSFGKKVIMIYVCLYLAKLRWGIYYE